MMSGQAKTQLGWAVAGLVALAGVLVLAFVKNEASQPQTAAGASLEDITQSAQSWETSFPTWVGREVPEFSVQDINGNKYALNDYRGRNLLVVFWATWCPACNQEIPHLIELRKAVPEEELGIVAISNEATEQLRQFVQTKGINYAVASLNGTALPAPFAEVSAIPTTFFIDANGRLKLAALGLVSLGEAKAILKAKL